MRFTWLVLGVVVAAGAVAFINTDDPAPDLPEAKADTPKPALNRADATSPAAANLDLSEEEVKAENRARALLKQIAAARADGKKPVAPLIDKLKRTAWDTPSARRFAYLEGRRLLKEAGKVRSKTSIAKKDKARRLMSRVLYLPEMFTKSGTSTKERTQLMATLQKINRQVMRYGTGIDGVTKSYKVPGGIVPVQIVSRERLMMGANGILYWNQGGNLDPKRLRAGQTLLLPLEELTLHVYQRYCRMGVFIGDWFVKEFRVGVGKDDSPTPNGEFKIYSRIENPPWNPPGGGRTIPYGDPRNELGAVWIGIENEEWPQGASYGIHGTKDPETIGTRCSNGCVRLKNPQARELLNWVRRKGKAGGKATRVFIQ